MEKEKEIHFWGVYVDLAHRLAWLGAVLSLCCTLIFSVLYAQGLLQDTYRIVIIVSLCLTVFFLIAGVVGLIGKARLRRLTSEDNNEKRPS